MNGTVSFVFKVILLSALLSLALKYGGQWLPITSPFTQSLNGLVITIVLLPSVAIGGLLLVLQKGSAQKT